MVKECRRGRPSAYLFLGRMGIRPYNVFQQKKGATSSHPSSRDTTPIPKDETKRTHRWARFRSVSLEIVMWYFTGRQQPKLRDI